MNRQMNHPPVNELERKAGCRYMLVTAVSKRSRQIMSAKDTISDAKPVSVAVAELYDGQLALEFPDEYSHSVEK